MRKLLSFRRYQPVASLCLLLAVLVGVSQLTAQEREQPFDVLLRNRLSRDAFAQQAASNSLLRMAVPTDAASLRSLGKLLGHDDYFVASDATRALKRLSLKAVPVLIDLLQEKRSPPARPQRILQLLEPLGPQAKDATAALLEIVRNPRQQTREEILMYGDDGFGAGNVLAKIGADAVPLLISTFPKCDAGGQRTLTEALERIVREDFFSACQLPRPVYQKAMPIFVHGLRGQDISLQRICATALAMLRIKDKGVILDIARGASRKTPEEIQDGFGGGEIAVIDALGGIGPPARCAAPYFKNLLDSRKDGIVWSALVAIGNIGLATDFTDKLVALTTHSAIGIREQSVRLLGQVERPSANVIKTLQERMQKDSWPFVRILAAHSLMRLKPGHADARACLCKACSHDLRDVRACAARLLGDLPEQADDAVLAALERMLDDSQAPVALDTAWAIGQMQTKATRSRHKLEQAALESDHLELRPVFAAALLRINPANTTARKVLGGEIGEFLALIRLPDVRWRLFIVEVLGLLADRRRVIEKEIALRTQDEDSRVRQAATRVLLKLRTQCSQ